MPKRGSVFQGIGSLRVGRSRFDLSYTKKFDCDMGQLIPVMCDECVPGDIWRIGNEFVIRYQPLVAPILHGVKCYVHYFFVPYRILWDDWEEFITGGVDGDFTIPVPSVAHRSLFAKGTLMDYFGFPTVIPETSSAINLNGGQGPNVFPWLSYNAIYDEYYRDQNLEDELGDYSGTFSPEYVGKLHHYGPGNGSAGISNAIKYRAWTKDYFTSATPWQQRGTAPALPITGQTSAVFNSPNGAVMTTLPNGQPVGIIATSPAGSSDLSLDVNGTVAVGTAINSTLNVALSNRVDLSTASTFDIADLRVAFQIQKWLERNARAGARYTEFIRAHFPAFPRDDRLQRPEYIGGTANPIIFSEVLQTSMTVEGESPQGNLAGHGISVNKGHVGTYHVKEFGLIMGIMSVMPTPAYQQGIDRQWLRRTKFDYYFPEFAHLSEQAIQRQEIYFLNDHAGANTDEIIFGYQGRYNEMRIKRDLVCNNMRDTLDYWHLGRQFSSAPLLNQSFLSTADIRKDVFAAETEPGLIVNFGNVLDVVRPMPAEPNPGLIDHF